MIEQMRRDFPHGAPNRRPRTQEARHDRLAAAPDDPFAFPASWTSAATPVGERRRHEHNAGTRYFHGVRALALRERPVPATTWWAIGGDEFAAFLSRAGRRGRGKRQPGSWRRCAWCVETDRRAASASVGVPVPPAQATSKSYM